MRNRAEVDVVLGCDAELAAVSVDEFVAKRKGQITRIKGL
jgi:hypothetical protein